MDFSYIKANGKGLSTILLDSIKISFSNNKFELTNNNSLNNYYFKQYNINDNYKLSVCAVDKAFPENITQMNIQTLIGYMK